MKFFLLVYFLLAACTNDSPQKRPSFEKYKSDTQLMLNICRKLSNEGDAKTLHKVAVSTLQARVVSCSDYYGECNQYGKFLSLAAELSKDSILTQTDREELKSAFQKLQTKVKTGRAKLKANPQ